MRHQPTDEQEAVNAAYVWMRQCQTELAAEARDGTYDNIAWAFERYRRACDKHEEMTCRPKPTPNESTPHHG